MSSKPSDTFSLWFEDLSPRIYASVRRRADPSLAEDVVAETFLIAWRRFADVPEDPLPWLLVVARNVLSDRQRRSRRATERIDIVGQLDQVAAPSGGPEQVAVEREQMLGALAVLSEADREALLLVAWDGLTNAQAAEVVGCNQRAFEVRLSRARARLMAAVDAADVDQEEAARAGRPREIRGVR
ncbi:RNA polymerase sigma factor [Nocardioides montaniterrae]